MVSMALVGLMLVVLGGLVQSYFQVLRRTGGRERGMDAVTTAAQAMGLDLSAAFRVDQPLPSGLPSSTVSLQRINPYAPGRFPTPLPVPAVAPFVDPYRTSVRWTVTYDLQGDRLNRTVTPGNSDPPFSTDVAAGLNSFSCRFLQNSAEPTVELTFTTFREGVAMPIVSQVTLHLPAVNIP